MTKTSEIHLGHTTKTAFVWMNGQILPQQDAVVSVLSHALHYGTSVFEGIRAYEAKKGTAIFRLKEHTKRLFQSAHILRMPLRFSQDEINQAIVDTVRRNGNRQCYIRPLVWRGGATLGVNPLPCPVEAMIAILDWGAYLGEDALNKGARLQTASWVRLPALAMPGKAKAGGNYINSVLARMDAVTNGFDEALMLDENGFVAEGTGENIFFVRDGVLHAIPHGVNLIGITRDSVIKIARSLNIEVAEKMATRDELFIADEMFMTGTGAEITPVTELDHRKIGDGKVGPLTLQIRNEFMRVVRGENEMFEDWLTYT